MSMSFADPFAAPGNWYKGNLHGHSTASDGRLAPEMVVRLYQDHGYDFLSITDHNKLTILDQPKFRTLLVPGEEIDILQGPFGNRIHLVALGISRPIDLTPEARQHADPRTVIRDIRAAGGEAIVAHPYWSMLSLDDIVSCREAIALEVFNTGCQVEVHTGYAMVQWDMYLYSGRLMYGIACDDAHAYHSLPQQPDDCLGGWVMVKASECTVPAIMESLRRGLFYSTCGPEILGIECDGRTICVRTSPVASITIRSIAGKGKTTTSRDGVPLTQAQYRLGGQERFVRVECTDALGRMAWANPIIVGE
jgi:hypothetical protein